MNARRNWRRYVLLVLGIMGLWFRGLEPVYAKDLKIGYVDSERIRVEYKVYADAQKKLNQITEEWRKQALDKRAEGDQLMSTYESQKLLLSDQRRAEMEEKIKQKYAEFEAFVQEFSAPGGKLDQKTQEVLKPILDKINGMLEKIGREEGYDFIFDIQLGIVYANDQYDLTDKVLEELGKETGE